MDTTPKLCPVLASELIEVMDLILRSNSRPDYYLDAAKSKIKELKKRL